MLVSEQTAQRMFNKNGWLYKSFSLFFKNKFWDKSVPQGFPICPYFWMALFMGVFLYPLILFPLGSVALPIFQWVGKNILGKSDKFLYNLFKLDEDDYTVGRGLLATFISLVVVALIISVLFCTVMALTILYTSLSLIGSLGLLIFYIGLTIPPFVGLRLYVDGKSHKCDSKHWMYTVVYGLVVIGLLAVLQPTALFGAIVGSVLAMGKVFSIIFGGVATLVGWVWFCICWVGGYIGIGMSKIWPVLSIALVAIAALLVALSILGLVGLLISRFTPAPKLIKTKFNDIKPAPRRYDYAWKLCLCRMFDNYDPIAMDNLTNYTILGSILQELAESLGIDTDRFDISKSMNNKVMMTIINQYFDIEKLDLLMYKNPTKLRNINDVNEIMTDISVRSEYFAYIIDTFNKIKTDIRELEYNNVVSDNIEVIFNKIKSDIQTHTELQDRYKQSESTRLRREARDAKVEKFCGRLIRLISPIGVGITQLGYVIKSIRTSSWNFVKRFFRGLLDIMSVGWKLLKKGKSEACPYFMFNDDDLNKTAESETEEDSEINKPK